MSQSRLTGTSQPETEDGAGFTPWRGGSRNDVGTRLWQVGATAWMLTVVAKSSNGSFFGHNSLKNLGFVILYAHLGSQFGLGPRTTRRPSDGRPLRSPPTHTPSTIQPLIMIF